MNHRLVYIAGPYSADTREQVRENIRRAEEAGKAVLLAGFVPIVPHRLFGLWDEDLRFLPWQHEDWISRVCLPVFHNCDGVLFIDGWEKSKGALMEMEFAKGHAIPVHFSIEGMIAHREASERMAYHHSILGTSIISPSTALLQAHSSGGQESRDNHGGTEAVTITLPIEQWEFIREIVRVIATRDP